MKDHQNEEKEVLAKIQKLQEQKEQFELEKRKLVEANGNR